MPRQQTLKSVSLYLWERCASRPQSLSQYFVLSIDWKCCPAWGYSFCTPSLVELLIILCINYSLNVFFLSLQMQNLILNWRTLPRSGSHWSGKSFGSLHFSHLLGGGSRSNLSLKWLKGNNGDFAPCSAACFRPNQQWILTRSRWLCLKSAIWWTI